VMPQMNGIELVEKLLAERPETKVIFMSGYTDLAIALSGTLRAGVPFLEKPFTSELLIRTLRQVLDSDSEDPAKS